MKMLAEVIHREIAARGGAIPFNRFMELALYCPNLGYYETKKDTVGRRGDFYTSVSVGSLFGELLAFQFADWLQELNAGGAGLKIVEAGAHNGQLARDILVWLRANRAQLFEDIEYCIIEPSPRRQEWQREMLEAVRGKVNWVSSLSAMRAGDQSGVIFSNELLDAFPVRRVGWDARGKEWFEWGVRTKGEGFAWVEMDGPPPDLPSLIRELPMALLEVLPDRFTTEFNPAATDWWRLAAGSLHRGKLMAVDYGLTAEEFFLPARRNGTLRAFFRHHVAEDLLANPGEQDLTAHVNFSEIQRAGEKAGLKTDLFSTQSQFLAQILAKTEKSKTFGEWTPARGRQFQTLTHPEHLGRAFRVLIQSAGHGPESAMTTTSPTTRQGSESGKNS